MEIAEYLKLKRQCVEEEKKIKESLIKDIIKISELDSKHDLTKTTCHTFVVKFSQLESGCLDPVFYDNSRLAQILCELLKNKSIEKCLDVIREVEQTKKINKQPVNKAFRSSLSEILAKYELFKGLNDEY